MHSELVLGLTNTHNIRFIQVVKENTNFCAQDKFRETEPLSALAVMWNERAFSYRSFYLQIVSWSGYIWQVIHVNLQAFFEWKMPAAFTKP